MTVFRKSWQDPLFGQPCPRDIRDFTLLGYLSAWPARVHWGAGSQFSWALAKWGASWPVWLGVLTNSHVKTSSKCILVLKHLSRNADWKPPWFSPAVHQNSHEYGHSFTKRKQALTANSQLILFSENVKFKVWFLGKGHSCLRVHWIIIPEFLLNSQLSRNFSYFSQKFPWKKLLTMWHGAVCNGGTWQWK